MKVDTGSSSHLFGVCVAWEVQEILNDLRDDVTKMFTCTAPCLVRWWIHAHATVYGGSFCRPVDGESPGLILKSPEHWYRAGLASRGCAVAWESDSPEKVASPCVIWTDTRTVQLSEPQPPQPQPPQRFKQVARICVG